MSTHLQYIFSAKYSRSMLSCQDSCILELFWLHDLLAVVLPKLPLDCPLIGLKVIYNHTHDMYSVWLFGAADEKLHYDYKIKKLKTKCEITYYQLKRKYMRQIWYNRQ